MLIDIIQIWKLYFGNLEQKQVSLPWQRRNFIKEKGKGNKQFWVERTVGAKVKNTKDLNDPENGKGLVWQVSHWE